MKKAAIFLAITFCIGLLSACGHETVTYVPLEQLPGDYTVEQAETDGCVVHKNGDIYSGQEQWERFLKDVAKGKEAAVRIANDYELLDPSRYGAEYYESIKDEYPKLYIEDLTYDGDLYTIRWYEGEEEYVLTYRYLMRYEEDAEGRNASYDSYIRYVLTNDNTVSWQDIARGMVSSYFGASIAHHSVYTDLIGGES